MIKYLTNLIEGLIIATVLLIVMPFSFIAMFPISLLSRDGVESFVEGVGLLLVQLLIIGAIIFRSFAGLDYQGDK